MFPIRALLVFLAMILLSPFVFADERIGSDLPPDLIQVLDGGTDAPGLAALPNGVDPTDDFGALASLTITAIRTGNWWALAALALSVVVSLARKFLGQKIPFLSSDRGGFLTVVLLALFGGLATSLIGGRSIGPDLLMDCLKVALTAAGGFVGFKKVFLDGAKISEAGNQGAAVTTGLSGVASKPLGS